jgi:HEAT repeat protein
MAIRRRLRRVSSVGGTVARFGQQTSPSTRQCFILMPFKPDLDELYIRVVKPTVERTRLFQCLRADEIYGPRPIMLDVWASIQAAMLVIADLTGRNPNVLYELGLAHALQKPVILLTQTIDDVPFDLRHLRVLIYRNTDPGRVRLQSELLKTIRAFVHDSPTGGYAVLEPPKGGLPYSNGRPQRALQSLASSDPAVVLKTLERLADEDEEKIRPHPRLSRVIASLLDSSHPEIQLAAIKALGATKERIHAPRLRPYLDSNNSLLVEATIEALGEMHDASVLKQLGEILSNPPTEFCGEAVVTALGKIGGRQATAILSAAVSGEGPAAQYKDTAIRALAEVADDASIETLLELDPARLDTRARSTLASALGEHEYYRPTFVSRLRRQLTTLLCDAAPNVRGAALGAWAILSHSDSGRCPRTNLPVDPSPEGR